MNTAADKGYPLLGSAARKFVGRPGERSHSGPPVTSAGQDLVDRAAVRRDGVQVAVRSGLEVGDDAEAAADEQALALGDLVLRDVVGHAVGEPRVLEREVRAVLVELEAEQVSADGALGRAADEEVAGEP